MEIRLLGGVDVIADDGAAIDVGPAKCRAVVAALALSAGSVVPQWQLVDAVWGDDPPRTAARTLQSYIARVRRALGQDTIIRSGEAYRLDVPPDAVDAMRFQRLLGEGRVDEALAEWRGRPLAGLDAPGLDTAAVGLTERWLDAVERQLEDRVEIDPAAAIAPLTELTATHPFREGLWALLMTALYRVGRQADALAAYRTAQDLLVEQLGVEPGPQLQALHEQVLRQEPRLAGPGATAAARAELPTGTVTLAYAEAQWSPDGLPGSERSRAMSMGHHGKWVEEVATRHGGHVFSRGGDTVGVAFHGVGSAVAWAEDLHDAATSGSGTDQPVRPVCVGVHTGEAERHGGGYYGPAANIAARLAAAGHAGQTLLSGITADIIGRDACRDIGWYRLDGVVAEQQVLQLGNSDHPPLRLEGLFRGNLPHRLGRLIGRDDELHTIDVALAGYPVVTLVGPGGIGKTRLALAAAGRAAVEGDAWLVELAEVDAPRQVPRAVADTLGVGERSGATLVQSIVEALGSRHALVVLDNAEHVVEAAADLADAVARGCPHVRVLVTSRERLGLTNERIVAVPPLDPTGAGVELFNERAAAVAAFDPVASRAAVEEICRRLDGLPLAIELAAARTSSLSPADLADRLHHRLALLDGARRTGTERHRTLQAAIRWSHDLLTPGEQVLFRRLCVFAGPFDLAAAEQVASGPALARSDLDAALGRLVDQSIVMVESGPFGRRFRLLEPIRQFGAECLAAAGEATLLSERHAQWCRSRVHDIHRGLAGWGELEAVARLAESWPNLRAAFDWACEVGDRDLATALVRPILSEIVLRSQAELGDWVERLLAVTPADDGDGIVFGLYWAAHRYSVSQDPAGYQRLVDEHGEPDHVLTRHGRAIATADHAGMARWGPPAVEELRRQGDDHLAERAEINVATAWLNLGRLQECDERLERLLARYRAQGPPTFVNWTLLLLGYSASFQGRQDVADAFFDDAIDVEVPPGTHTPNKPLEARAAFRRGNHLRAFRTLRSHVDELLTTENTQASGIDFIEFVNMMTKVDRLPEASLVLAHLEATGLLDSPAWRSLVTESATAIAAAPAPDRSGARALSDDRAALEYVRQVLDDLVGGR